jgi:hypothetical protein
MPQPVLNARALKCTIVLDPAEVAQIVASDGKPRTIIAIRLPDRRVSADLNAKSVRKAVAAIGEHGPDGVAVIIQGKLVGDLITEAGIVAQPRVKPSERPHSLSWLDELEQASSTSGLPLFRLGRPRRG